MGWWWSSSSPSENKPAQQPPTPSIPTSTIPPSSIPPTTAPPSYAPSNPDHDADFYAAHPHLAPSSQSADPSSQSQTSSASPTDRPALVPDYPTTMSCRAAFDSAFYCSSFGGHFNDIYRYGEMRSCGEHWADWRFCMGLKTRSKADKELLIQQRYREKEDKVRSKPNSEDVWTRRAEGERMLGAFAPVVEGQNVGSEEAQ